MSGWRDEWRALPPLTRFGSITIGVGGVADVIAHLQAPAPGASFTTPQQLGHLVILLGMVATLSGVLLDAFWPPSRDRQSITPQGGSHANR